MAPRKLLLSRLRLVGIVAGAVVLVDVCLLATGAGPFERLQAAAVVFLGASVVSLVFRHRARFGLKTFLVLVPAVALFAMLASEVGQQLYRQQLTAAQISQIGGSYFARRVYRQHGLADVGDYCLPESLIDLIGEDSFREIRDVTIPVQSLRAQRVDRWKLEGIRRIVLVNEGEAAWPVEQLTTLLSAPDLERVSLPSPVSASQMQVLVVALRGRPVHLNVEFSGNVELETLRQLRSLSGPEVMLQFGTVKLSAEAAAAIGDIPNVSSLWLTSCSFPPTATQSLVNVHFLVMRGMTLPTAAIPPLLNIPVVELQNCTIQADGSTAAIASGDASTHQLALRSVSCSPAALSQLLMAESLDTLYVEQMPLSPETVKQIAEHPSLKRVLVNGVGMPAEQLQNEFRRAAVPAGRRPWAQKGRFFER